MIRRASIPGARPRPRPASPAPSRARRPRARAPRAARRTGRRASAGRQPLEAGRARGRSAPRPRRRRTPRTPAPAPPRPAGAGRSVSTRLRLYSRIGSRPVSSSSSRRAASAGVSPASMWPCTVSHDPGQRPPGRAPEQQALERAAGAPQHVQVDQRRRGSRSRPPPREGVEQLDARPLRLLRMELRAEHVAVAHDGREHVAVVAGGQHVVLGQPRPDGSCARDRRTAARPGRAAASTACARARRGRVDPRPARRAARAASVSNRRTSPGRIPSPRDVRRLVARREEELQAEADAHDRPARAPPPRAPPSPSPRRARGCATPGRSGRRRASRTRSARRTSSGSAVSVASCPPAARARTTLFRLFTP